MVARSREGTTRAFPVVETIHRNSILLVTEAPAHVPEDVRQRAREVAESAVACLDGKLLRLYDTMALPASWQVLFQTSLCSNCGERCCLLGRGYAEHVMTS